MLCAWSLYVIIHHTFFPIDLANEYSILIHQSQTKVDSDAIFHCSFPWTFWDIKNREQILNSLINSHWPFGAPRTLTSTAWSCIFDHVKFQSTLIQQSKAFYGIFVLFPKARISHDLALPLMETYCTYIWWNSRPWISLLYIHSISYEWQI